MPDHIPGMIGRMDSFDENVETWESYFERFEQYIKVNKIPEDSKVACLLSVMGAKTYSLYRTLIAPLKPADQTLDAIKMTLKNHMSPEPLVIAERFRFYKRDQKPGESISNYIAVLKKLAETCKFGNFLAEALRDRLVCGIFTEQIQKRLLTEKNLTLDTALQIAVSMEAAQKDAHEFSKARVFQEVESEENGATVTAVNKFASKSTARKSKNSIQNKCFRCGRTNHNPDECLFKDRECHQCGKKGHIKPMCRKKVHYHDCEHDEVEELEENIDSFQLF